MVPVCTYLGISRGARAQRLGPFTALDNSVKLDLASMRRTKLQTIHSVVKDASPTTKKLTLHTLMHTLPLKFPRTCGHTEKQ